jgi:hypothetical protein
MVKTWPTLDGGDRRRSAQADPQGGVMANAMMPLRPALPAPDGLCRISPGARMRWHRIASPPD